MNKLFGSFLRILCELSRESLGNNNEGWVRPGKIAKKLQGSHDDGNIQVTQSLVDKGVNDGYVKRSRPGHVIPTVKAIDKVNSMPVDEGLRWDDPNSVSQTVKHYASTLSEFRFNVTAVSKIDRIKAKYIYRILIEHDDDELLISTGTQAKLDGKFCTVIGKDDGSEPAFYLISESDLVAKSHRVSLVVDRGFLLSKLADRIIDLWNCPKHFKELIFDQADHKRASRCANSGMVSQLILNEDKPITRLIWGPPGAGKTYCLGQLVADYISKSLYERILLLAPSNLAADVLMLETLGAIRRTGQDKLIVGREVLRYGYPAKHEILRTEEILGSKEHEELTSKIKSLSEKIGKLKHYDQMDEYLSKYAELFVLREELKKVVDDHLKKCRIVTTSTTLGYLPTSPIFGLKWDIVVIDEVTMVPPALIYCIAGCKPKRLILSGDPRQLGPVFEETKCVDNYQRDALGRDIFAISRIVDITTASAQLKESSSTLVRIMEQRRCHPAIWSLVHKWYPEVTTNYSHRPELTNKTLFEHRIYHLDISSCSAGKCQKKGGRSWINEFSARLCVDVTGAVFSTYPKLRLRFGIITPFAAQERLIRSLIKRREKDDCLRFDKELVEVGTIHRFQGSSADVIIVDLVGSVGKEYLGPLLSDTSGIRLLTVAFTRAKEMLIIISNVAWHRKMLSNDGNNQLLEYIMDIKNLEKVSPEFKLTPVPRDKRQIITCYRMIHSSIE